MNETPFFHPVGELQEPELNDEGVGLLSVGPPKIDYKAKDKELYDNWAHSRSKKDMTILVRHLTPILVKEVNRGVGTLPTAALMGEAKNWAIKGIKTFDASKGFALSTHVTNYIQRTRRLNYKYQLVARLPEDMRRDYPDYNRVKMILSEELNEDPTVEQIASRLGWPKAKVQRFNDRVYSDEIESTNDTPMEITHYSDNDLRMKALMSQLTEEDRFILHNKGNMSSSELAAKLGMDTNRLNYVSRKLKDKIVLLKQELKI